MLYPGSKIKVSQEGVINRAKAAPYQIKMTAIGRCSNDVDKPFTRMGGVGVRFDWNEKRR